MVDNHSTTKEYLHLIVLVFFKLHLLIDWLIVYICIHVHVYQHGLLVEENLQELVYSIYHVSPEK